MVQVTARAHRQTFGDPPHRHRRLSHEDQFAPVTAIHDVIKRASLLDSQLAGHDGSVALGVSCINIKNRPLFEVRDHVIIGREKPSYLSST